MMKYFNGFKKTTIKTKFAGLDHLRALAITLVFLYHYRGFGHPGWVENVSSFGWTGVDLFFVLSGFLIAGQLFNKIYKGEPVAIKEFYLKRFFRIIPAYLVVVTLYFCFPAFREHEALSPLWRFLTFTQNLGLDVSHYGTFSHSWSLCIEEQFYFLLPLIIAGLLYIKAGKKALYVVPFLFVSGFVIRLLVWYIQLEPVMHNDNFWLPWHEYMYYPTYTRLDGLLAGITVAGIFQFVPAFKTKLANYGNLLLLAGIVLITAAFFVCITPSSFIASIFGFPLVAVAYGVIVAAVISPSCFFYKYGSIVTAKLAELSYSVYLVHKAVIHLTQNAFSKQGIDVNSNTMFLLCVTFCLLAALAMRYIIEKPFMKLRDKVLAPKAALTMA